LTTNTKNETVFPIRGIPGGWRDPWDEPDDHAELRAQAERAERRLGWEAECEGQRWRVQIECERRQ
jgi:hypothetical protein